MRKKIISVALITSFLFSGCALNAGNNPDKYIQLGQYKNLNVTRVSTDVTEEDIENELNESIDSYLEPVKVLDRDTVEKGDIVNIDYTGRLNGVAFDGGSAKGFDLTIGSGTFIDGFEDGLIGVKTGEEVVLDLTFPDYYPNNEDLAGQLTEFTVKVNSISHKPEVTDDIVKEATAGEYATINDYKVYIKEDLEKSAAQYADSIMYDDLWSMAVDNATVTKDFPEDMLKEKVDKMRQNAQSYAAAYGVDFDTYLSGMMGVTREEFDAQIEDYAVTAAKESMVLLAIAKAEGLEVTSDELNKAIDEYVELYQYDSAEDFKNSVDLKDFEEYILLSKVQEFLADNAVIDKE